MCNFSKNTSRLLEQVEKEEKFSVKKMNKFLDESKYLLKQDDDCKSIFIAIKLLEAKEVEINSVMNNMKRQGLQRINNEFLTNNYGRRFNVTQEEVISALVGEKTTFLEYSQLLKDQKV